MVSCSSLFRSLSTRRGDANATFSSHTFKLHYQDTTTFWIRTRTKLSGFLSSAPRKQGKQVIIETDVFSAVGPTGTPDIVWCITRKRRPSYPTLLSEAPQNSDLLRKAPCAPIEWCRIQEPYAKSTASMQSKHGLHDAW
jgi:hypothetical protein